MMENCMIEQPEERDPLGRDEELEDPENALPPDDAVQELEDTPCPF